MGMYDCLNGEQIKCFYNVVHYKDINDDKWMIYHSGGQLRSYSIGDDLPLKTFYYNYPKDFLIIDEHCEILHTVMNGKLIKTEPLRFVESVDSDLLAHVYNYNGVELDISSLDKLKEYPKAHAQRIESINKFYKEYKPSNALMIKSFRILKEQTNKLEELAYMLEEDDFTDLNSFLDSLNFNIALDLNSKNKSKFILRLLLDNKEYEIPTKEFIKNKANELFYRFNDRDEEEEKALKEVLNPYLQSYNNLWIKNDCFKTEKKIGYYFSIINELDELKQDIPDFFNEKDKESYLVALNELKYLIDEHGVDSYIKWLDPSQEKLKTINSILDSVNKNV